LAKLVDAFRWRRCGAALTGRDTTITSSKLAVWQFTRGWLLESIRGPLKEEL
jgi:hypothetical protein